jgi:rhodanese-related sulfurtransferase
MKKVLLVGMLGILIVFIACTNVRSLKNVPRVSKDYLKAKLGSPDLVLVDVRSKNDWENSSDKITGAVRMDPKAVDTWLETLPKDREIILYCA